MLPTTQAPCGLDCATCDAYRATQSGDEALKLTVLEQWRKDYSPDVPLAAVTCDGCITSGCRKGGYTGQCPVRACAQERKQPTCAHCPEYKSCVTLAGFLGHAATLRVKLEAIRTMLGMS
jgi:hypothetical protein